MVGGRDVYKVDLPNGMKAFGLGTASDGKRHQDIISARHAFVLKYMAEKEWGDDPSDLTIEQIIEIRQQNGWKDPLKETSP